MTRDEKAEHVVRAWDKNFRQCQLKHRPSQNEIVLGLRDCGRWFDMREHPWGINDDGEQRHWKKGPRTCPECFEHNSAVSRSWNDRKKQLSIVTSGDGAQITLADWAPQNTKAAQWRLKPSHKSGDVDPDEE